MSDGTEFDALPGDVTALPVGPRRVGGRRRAGRGRGLVGGDRLRAGVTCGPPLIRGPGGCLIGPCCGRGSSGGSVSRWAGGRSRPPRGCARGRCWRSCCCTRDPTRARGWRGASGPMCSTPAPARRCAARCGRCASRSPPRAARPTSTPTAPTWAWPPACRARSNAERFAALAEAGDAASLEAAVALADGPLLPDLADEWVLEEQDRHRDRLIAVLERLAALAEEAGDDPRRRALDPGGAGARPAARGGAPRADAPPRRGGGRRRRRWPEYVRLRDALAAELGMRPSEETRALARAHPGRRRGAARPGAARADPRARAAAAFVGPGGGARRPGRGVAHGGGRPRRPGGAGGARRPRQDPPAAGPGARRPRRRRREAVGRGPRPGGRAAAGAVVGGAATRWRRPRPPPPPEAGWPADLARLVPAVEAGVGRGAARPVAAARHRARPHVGGGGGAAGLVGVRRAGAAGPRGPAPRRPAPAWRCWRTSGAAWRSSRCWWSPPAARRRPRRPSTRPSPPSRGGAAARAAGARAAGRGGDRPPGRRAPRPASTRRPPREVVAAAAGNPLLAREAGARRGRRARPRGRPARLGPRPAPRASPRAPGRWSTWPPPAAARWRWPRPPTSSAPPSWPARSRRGVAAGLLELAGRRVGLRPRPGARGLLRRAGRPRAVGAHGRLAEVLARRPEPAGGRGGAAPAPRRRRRGRGALARRGGAGGARAGRARRGRRLPGRGRRLVAGDPAREAELWLDLADLHAWRADLAAMEAAAGRARPDGSRGRRRGPRAARRVPQPLVRTTLCVPRPSRSPASRAALARIDDARLTAGRRPAAGAGERRVVRVGGRRPGGGARHRRAVRAMPRRWAMPWARGRSLWSSPAAPRSSGAATARRREGVRGRAGLARLTGGRPCGAGRC